MTKRIYDPPELTRLLRQGDRAAWQHLNTAFKRGIQRQLGPYLYGSSVAQAYWEDIFQDSMLRVHRVLKRRKNLQIDENYLFTICRNRALRVIKQNRYCTMDYQKLEKSEHGQFDPRTNDTEAAAVERLLGEVAAYVEKLPAQKQEILQLVLREGLTVEEAADYLHVKHETFRKSYYRTRKEIAKAIPSHR